MQLLFLPIVILNFLVGLLGGVWLLFYEGWSLVIFVIISGIASPYFLSLLIASSMIFVIPAVKLEETGHIGYRFFLSMISLAWTYAVLAAWCVTIFSIALS